MAEGENQNEESIHHDDMNEFGEETWSSYGTRQITHSSQEENDETLPGVEVLHVGTEGIRMPAGEDSYETYESNVFLTEEVDTLVSKSIENTVEDLTKDNADDTKISIASTSSKRLAKFAEFCRICHDSNCRENFISPCECRGSLYLVHKSCLERWLAQSDTTHCELCGASFEMQRFPRYGLFESVGAWMKNSGTWRDRRKMLIDILAFLFITPVVYLANHLSFKLTDFFDKKLQNMNGDNDDSSIMIEGGYSDVMNVLFTRVCEVGVVMTMLTVDMAYASWIGMRLQYHVNQWYKWYRRNCRVILIGYPEICVSVKQEPSTGSTAHIKSVSF